MKTIYLYSSVEIAYSPVEVNEEIIVPVVMMVEGVHNGSHGKIYHPITALTSGLPFWQDKPITLSHPQTLDGKMVSVNEVSADAWVIGAVKNAKVEDGKLKASAHFNVQKLTALSPDTLETLRSGKIIEVSIGIFSVELEQKGTWNNEQYDKIALNHEPDHLALLPGEIGACSIMDGCGVRANSNQKKGGNENVIVDLRSLNTNGLFALPIVYAKGLKERLDKIRTSLYSRDTDNEMYYLEEVYDGYAIFNQTVRDGKTFKESLYKQTYSLNADGEIAWQGVPEKVVREIKYKTVNNNKKEEEKTMCEKCKEKAKALVANANTHFTDDDLSWLEEMPEDRLDKFIPKVVTNTKTKTVEVEKEVTPDQAWKVLKLNKAQYDKGIEFYNEKRTAVIKTITDNTEEGVWTDEDLDGMKLETLEKLAKSVKKEKQQNNQRANGFYVGSGIQDNGEESGPEPLYFPGVEFEDKK